MSKKLFANAVVYARARAARLPLACSVAYRAWKVVDVCCYNTCQRVCVCLHDVHSRMHVCVVTRAVHRERERSTAL